MGHLLCYAADTRSYLLAQVLFNIGGPALNQLNNAANKGKSPGFKKAQKTVSKAFKKRAAIGAIVGLSAASLLAAAPQADAAQEIMQLSAGDCLHRVYFGLTHLFEPMQTGVHPRALSEVSPCTACR